MCARLFIAQIIGFLVLLLMGSGLSAQAQQRMPALMLGQAESASRVQEECAIDGSTPVVGQQILVQGLVGNGGQNTLPGTKLMLTITAEMQFVPGTEQAQRGTWTVQAQQADLNIGDLGPGETVTWQIDLLAMVPGVATFTEVFTSSNGGQAEQSCTITIEGGEAVVALEKAASVGPVIPVGTTFDYRIGIDNTGTVATGDVSLDDALPLAVDFVNATTSQGFCSYGAPKHTVACDFGPIDPGTGVDVVITVTANRPGDATNTITLEEQSATVEITIVGEGGGIFGRKWRDEDADGEEDAGEGGVGDVLIYLDENGNSQPDANERQTATDSQGGYGFEEVEPGVYTVREVVPEGAIQTFPPEGGHTVEVEEGVDVSGINFGNALLLGAIHGFKYFDINQDGVYDVEAGDRRLDGITIQLYDLAGNLIAEEITHSRDENEDGVIDPRSEQGLFWFVNLPLGIYRVVEVVPEGWEPTFPTSGEHIVELTPDTLVAVLIFGNFAPWVEDWGDLPDPLFIPPPSRCAPLGFPICYITLLPFGPSHLFNPADPNPLRFGTLIDEENNGLPDFVALGDDFDPPLAMSDEDGVGLVIFKDGGVGEVEIEVSGPAGQAFIDAWIDFDEDGILGSVPGEQIFTAMPVVVPSTLVYSFTIPAGLDAGTFGRFRISSNPFGLSPTGLAFDGEVEDYAVFGIDYGDAREDNIEDFLAFPQRYPVVLPSNGARHAVSIRSRLGRFVDHDDGGANPTILASGDDTQTANDDDGIAFTEGFFERTITLGATVPDPAAGRPFAFHAMARGTTVELVPEPNIFGKLNAWVDFNRDGDWDDEGEQVFMNEEVLPVSGAPTDTLRFDVPAEADLGYTYARFRFNIDGGLNPTGGASDGEVEDYLLEILNTVTALQLINGLPAVGKQTDPVDVYVDGVLLVDDFAPGTATDFLTLPLASGLPLVEVVPGDAPDNSAPLVASEVDFEKAVGSIAGANILALTESASGGIDLLLKRDARPAAADPGKADVFIVHAVPGDGALDVQIIGGDSLADDLAFGETTDYRSLDPDRYNLDVTTGDGAARLDVFRLDLTAHTGQTLTLLLIGRDGSHALTAFDAEGSRIDPPVVTSTDEAAVPHRFVLHGNYPNPFNPQTTIRFALPQATEVWLTIYDVLGREVARLVEGTVPAGQHEAVFDAASLPTGVYVYRLQANGFTQARRMLLVK